MSAGSGCVGDRPALDHPLERGGVGGEDAGDPDELERVAELFGHRDVGAGGFGRAGWL